MSSMSEAERVRQSMRDGLPEGWIWTRRGFCTPEGFTLYAARDSRWDTSVPDMVTTSERGMILGAVECNEAR